MKNQSGTKYKQGEIVLVPFPYSDLSSTKKRPVLVVSNDRYNSNFEDIIVCVITSNRYIDDFSLTLSNNDLKVGVLPEESVVKAHKLFTIHKSKIIKKFSEVDEIYFKKVYNTIKGLIKNN